MPSRLGPLPVRRVCSGQRSHSPQFRVTDAQVLLHDAPGIEVEVQGVVQDEETDVLIGVREVYDEYSYGIMGDTWTGDKLNLGAPQFLTLESS